MSTSYFNAEDAKRAERREGELTVHFSSSATFTGSILKEEQTLPENESSRQIIGAAIEVHRHLGPGLVEKVYEEALCHELKLRKIPFQRQESVPIYYKGVSLASDLRLDLLVGGKVIVDNKAKADITEQDRAQVLTYLRLSRLRLGLILNFHAARLVDGVTRVVNGLNDGRLPAPGSFKI